MSVMVKCRVEYDRQTPKIIVTSRGCCTPTCPPVCCTPCVPQCSPPPCNPCAPVCDPCCTIPLVPPVGLASARICGPCAPCSPVPCMSCPPLGPIPPCPPCPFICPPCTGYPCITTAPIPKPVPAPCEPILPVVRTPINTGGLFYIGTSKCYPCLPPACPPPCMPYTPISGMSVIC
ncbi:hypothetical protein KPH14_012113 [Odynerus spinipes]|uniref:Sperm mitochondrial-associated cysteine-rich protein-like n=1 Tax=Odynerus spinipes TaxID=1348599 RepID=A0AAD9R9V9_9HYME|nr:hypothetical protein KPH14_012113 [Odynerus spinipes]